MENNGKQTALVFMKKGYEDIELFLKQNFECRFSKGNWGDPFPLPFADSFYTTIWIEKKDEKGRYEEPQLLKFDWIFSWLSPWKIPEKLIKIAKKGAINFHPGPPKYPGIGCYNYAIWNQDQTYEVTCHWMDDHIDHGNIIRIYQYDLEGNETIEILKNRAITELRTMFYDIMNLILRGDVKLPSDYRKWGDYKSRKDFQEFCSITDDIIWAKNAPYINTELLETKLRATYFKGARDGPYIKVNGKKWRLIPEEDIL